MDEKQSDREYTERSDQREREEVAMLKAENLMAQWEAVKTAEAAANAAKAAYIVQRNKYTDMLAQALRITIGMRVRRTLRPSYLRKQTIVKTYEVTKYALQYGPTTLALWGRTVKKDGTLGEKFDIGTDWERV